MLIGVVAEAKLNALHHWPAACGKRSYLAHYHMHEFIVRVWIRVSHTDRQVEIHDLRDEIYTLLYDLHTGIEEWDREKLLNFGSKSCEDIAVYLMENIPFAYRAEVLEEGKDGAEVLSVPQA